MGNFKFYYNEIFSQHHTLNHPESEKRLEWIKEYFSKKTEFLGPKIKIDYALPLLIHSQRVVDIAKLTSEQKHSRIDYDTICCEHSYDAAIYALNLSKYIIDFKMKDKKQVPFLLLRPPGHHATKHKSMGFCIFNNIALAAMHCHNTYKKRVAILDFDVHHGNGTQDILYDKPILYISIHQNPLFPNTGFPDETGAGAGKGYNYNFPLPPGSEDRQWAKTIKNNIYKILDSYKPEVLLISAGFDAHKEDALSQTYLTKKTYLLLADIIKKINDKYCRNKLIFFLEGGYSKSGLIESIECLFNTFN